MLFKGHLIFHFFSLSLFQLHFVWLNTIRVSAVHSSDKSVVLVVDSKINLVMVDNDDDDVS